MHKTIFKSLLLISLIVFSLTITPFTNNVKAGLFSEPKLTQKQFNDQLKISAKTFGTKPVDKLQAAVGYAYSSTQISENKMGYGFIDKIGKKKVTLIRVDNTTTGITKVYKYDKKKPNSTSQKPLYVGQTIQRKESPRYILQ